VRILPALLLLFSALSHSADSISVSGAWLRAVAPGQNTSAAYMALTNTSAQARRLLAISSPQARAIEVHESIQVDGMWRMRRLTDVTVPAGANFNLQPGGAHLMVFGLAPGLRHGDVVSFTLQLDNNEKILVSAEVRAPG
jgi:copper(I)-binding protein